MKKVSILAVLVASVFLLSGLSYPDPHADLEEIKPKVFDYQSETYREILKRIQEIGKENEVKIDFVFDDSTVPADASPESAVLKSLDIYRIIRFLTAELGIALDVEKREGVNVIYLYEPIAVKEIRITSKLPYLNKKEYPFSGAFKLQDFIEGKVIPESITVTYNWRRDTMQVGSYFNHLIARGARRESIPDVDKEVGFAVSLATEKGMIYFYVDDKTAEFLNLNHTKESSELMSHMIYRMLMLLPEDYRRRMIDAIDYND